MAENAKDLSREQILRLFHRLDTVLVRRGDTVTVYIVGGADIALTVDGSRTTADIDAVVKHGYSQLVSAASEVAETEAGLAVDWINAEFTGGDDPVGGLFWRWFDNRGDDHPRSAFRGTGLNVELASPEMS